MLDPMVSGAIKYSVKETRSMQVIEHTHSCSEADVAIGLNCSMLSVEIGSAHQKVRAQTAVRLPLTHARHAAIGFHMHVVVNSMIFQRRKPREYWGIHPHSFERRIILFYPPLFDSKMRNL